MPTAVRFGCCLPQQNASWEEAKSAALEFETLGFDSLWVGDHLLGFPTPADPILEAWTQLAAVAAVTTRIELGTLVSPPFFRNPAVLAKQIATVDRIAGGRVIAGFGAGWLEEEHTAYGLPFPSIAARMRALEESVEVARRLWTEERVTYAGRTVQTHDAWCEPKPVRTPPILIAGGGKDLLMGIVARQADIWNNPTMLQAWLAKRIAVLQRRCADEGRDIATLTISQDCAVGIAPQERDARRALDAIEARYRGTLRGDFARRGLWGTPQQVIDRVAEHVALGCTLLTLSFEDRDAVRLFSEEVMPAFA